MENTQITQTQERWCQLMADGMESVAAYREAVGNHKLKASSARANISRWKQNVAIMQRLVALREKTDTDKTLRRQEKREVLSDMVKKLVKEFDKTLTPELNDKLTPLEKAVAKVGALEAAGKLAGHVAKLISVDNRMSGDDAPIKTEEEQNINVNVVNYGNTK